jgi:C4-dicarboxylate-specific signal transduction histidine kinase
MAFPPQWQLTSWPVLALIVLVLIQAMVIAVLMRRRARQGGDARAVREQRRELAHLSRVATVGELSGALAHELNQPLAAILSNAQAAQRFLGSEPIDVTELRAILSDIVDADKRAAAVIDRVRTLLRKQESPFVVLNVNEVVKETIDLAHSEFVTRRVSIVSRWTADQPSVLGDRVQLQQVLLNLMLNACDAMNSVPFDDRILLITTAVDPGGFVRIDVADRGTGIPAADIDRVFEPFFSSKGQGLGLGLSICRSIITAHAGRLWAANNAERGATFFIRLPIETLRPYVAAGADRSREVGL